MELLLTIRGGDSPGQEAYSHRFDESGGTIGRSARNDWRLRDPDRYVSERHARIEYRDGRFLLTDLSTNGTYLNDSRHRIPRQDTVALEDGDQLSMGNLLIDVKIFGAESRVRREDDKFRRRPRRDSTRPQPREDQTNVRPRGHGSDRAREGKDPSSAPPIPEEWQDLIAGFFESAADRGGPVGREMPNERHPSRSAQDDTAARIILDELGIEELAADIDPYTFGREVGRILRMVTDGLMKALQTRADIKNKFRLEQTQMRAAGNNPLKSSANLEAALRRLFLDDEDGGYISGAAAFREAFDDLRTHELAILAAVHASIEAAIANFDPQLLKKKLRRIAPVSAATPVLNNAKAWSLYEEHYQEVASQLRDDARLGFLREFAKAYEAATGEMRSKSKSGKSDD